MPHYSANPRLHRRLGVRKEFPQGLFNGVLKGFDSTRGYYKVKYEDGDSEEMSEDEVFDAARFYRKFRLRQGTINSGVNIQVARSGPTTTRKPVEGVSPTAHAIPVDESIQPLVTGTTLTAAPPCKETIFKLCQFISVFWALLHLVYTVITWVIKMI